MATNIIERLLVEVGLDFSKFAADADKAISKNDKLGKSLGDTEDASKKSEKASKGLSKEQAKAAKEAAELGKSIASATKALTKMFSTILISVGMNRLIDQVAKANDELYFLEKNLGMNAKNIKAWQGAAMASGGTAEGMTASLSALKQSMNGLVMFGDTSMLPYFNALGVSMVDNYGKVRKLDDVMLDLSDSLSKMPRDQAYTLGKQMGLDDGTLNTLMMGRKELQAMLDLQKQMYRAGEKELQASREFNKQRAILNMHWESMKNMIGDMLIPVLTKLIKAVSGFFDYVQRHRRAVEKFFEGLAIVLGILIIPMFKAALTSALAFFAPFSPFILVIAALAAAFLGLYDDYKTWAAGGNSLFDWGRFKDEIDAVSRAIGHLKDSFLDLTKPMYDAIDKAAPEFTKSLGKLVALGASALGIEGADEALKIHANAEVNGGTYVPPPSAAKKRLPVSRGGSYANVGGSTPTFRNKNFTKEKAESIAKVANRIGVDPNDLAAVISFETAGSFNPNIRNPGSSATGLIQFMGKGATKGGKYNDGKYYGMSRNEFGALSFDEQMKYVEKYFRERGFDGKKKRDVADTYTAVTGYGYRKGSREYELNKVWDSNKDGYIDKGEMVRNSAFREHQRNYYSSDSDLVKGAQNAKNMVSQGQQMQQGDATQNDNRKYTDVKIGDINIQTSSDTVGGNVNDAMKSVNSYMNQLGTSMS